MAASVTVTANLLSPMFPAFSSPPPTLAKLPLFVNQHLPKGWQSDGSAVVYRTVHDRFVIQFESHGEAHWGTRREAQLQASGVDSLGLDCHNFAKDLVEQLRDHLSLKEMQAVAAELQAEATRRDAEHHEVLELLDQFRGVKA